MKEYVDIRVVGHGPELDEFLKLCQLIQTCGTYGASRKINVSVDGDGSGKLSFSLITKDKDLLEVPAIPHDVFTERDKGGLEIDIGE